MSEEADLARSEAFAVWLHNAAKPSKAVPQRPEHELLAEHHLMRAVIPAMEEEARRLLKGGPLRPDFWNHAVDFIGCFTHEVHRAKEEQVFFPALEKWGLLDPADCQRLEEDHARLRDMTLLLCQGVSEGDWEKAFRVVAMYVARIGPHLREEEERLRSGHLDAISPMRYEPVLKGFAQIEADKLPEGGRMGVVEVARWLCQAVGLEEPRAEAVAVEA